MGVERLLSHIAQALRIPVLTLAIVAAGTGPSAAPGPKERLTDAHS
jgi:hypothetical protein